MAVTAYKSPGTTTEDTSVGSQGITSYSSLAGSGATISWATGTWTSYRYKLTNFGFTTADIPAGATINGFEIAFTRTENSSTDNLTDTNIHLIQSDTTVITGTNLASNTEWGTTSSEVIVGSSTNMMGYTGATAADMLDVDFGIAFQAGTVLNGTTPAGSLGFFKIRVYYTASTGSTLTAAQGSFSLTGQSANTLFGRSLPSGVGSIAFTGNAAGLVRGYTPLTAAQGALTLTGQDAGSIVIRTMSSAVGTFAFTGNAAGLNVGRVLPSAQGSFTLAGQAALFIRGYGVTAAQGAFTLTGNAANLVRTTILTASQGAFTLTGQNASLRFFSLLTDYGSFTVAGSVATLTVSGLSGLQAGQGAFTFTGNNANLVRGYPLVAAQGALTLTGNAAGVLKGSRVAAAQGALTLTGNDANTIRTRIVTATQGAFSLTGSAANVLKGSKVTAGQGALTFTGSDAQLITPKSITASHGVFTFTGPDAQLLYGGFGRKYLVVADDTAWVELIRRVNTQMGYPYPTGKTTRHCFKMTHTDGRRALVMEQIDYPYMINALTSAEMAALITTEPVGFAVSTTSPPGEFPHTASVAIVCEGDSIITGDYNLDGGVGWLAESEKFYYQLMVALGSLSDVTAVNLGVGGSKFADLASRQAANIDNLNWPTGCERVMCLMVGSNDIHHDGMTPSNAYAELKTRIAAYKAANPTLKVVVMTPIARSTSTTNQLAYRDLIVAGHTSSDLGSEAVANTGGLTQFDGSGDVTNATYYVDDQVHPKAAGIVPMASEVASAVQSVCAGV